MSAVLVIEDDDGFTTSWPWPEDRLALANGDFVAICESAHDEARARESVGRENQRAEGET